MIDEEALIRSARKGNLDAFNSLVMSYQDRAYHTAYRLMGSRQAAEDATQDAFLIAYQKLDQYKGGSFRSWLLRIVTNLCLDELRRNKRHPMEALEPVNSEGYEVESPHWMADPAEGPEELAERAELRGMIQKSLNNLPVHFRTALVLVDIQELSYAEAASIMNISVGTLKSRVSRGRTMVMNTLKYDMNFLHGSQFAAEVC